MSTKAEMLQPLPNAVGIFPQFIAHQQTTLVLREKCLSWSGNDFHIKDAGNGMSVLCVRGKTMSMSGRKEVSDVSGNHLFTIRKELMSVPTSFYCEDPAGNRFLDVTGKFSLLKPKSAITFVNTAGDKKPVKLQLVGNIMASKADLILETGEAVAKIHRDRWTVSDMFGGKQTYYLTVAPGFDLAAAAAICICLDERHHESSGGGGSSVGAS